MARTGTIDAYGRLAPLTPHNSSTITGPRSMPAGGPLSRRSGTPGARPCETRYWAPLSGTAGPRAGRRDRAGTTRDHPTVNRGPVGPPIGGTTAPAPPPTGRTP